MRDIFHPLEGATSHSVLEPIRARERIAEIDILRGFALFGILIVNMVVFDSPIGYFLGGVELFPDTYNQLARYFIRFAAESKFYTMFSLLFGLGFAVQIKRAEAANTRFGGLFCRRVLILLVIGQLHAHLIWNGDILTVYAILGFVLLLFRRRKPRTLLIWAIVFLAIPVLLSAFGTVAVSLARMSPQGAAQVNQAFAQMKEQYVELGDNAMAVYPDGSWSEIYRQRLKELGFFYSWMPLGMCPNVLAMFLVGLYVGKRQIHAHIEQRARFFRRLLIWTLPIGVICNVVYVVAISLGSSLEPSPVVFAGSVAIAVGAPALCFAYVSAIILVTRNAKWKARLLPLAAVGRLALSNYLLQSVICTLLFYSYGLGLFGKIGPAVGLLLTVIIFAVQVIISQWWLNRFRFGPAEWLWRTLTYAKRQPMRKAAPSP